MKRKRKVRPKKKTRRVSYPPGLYSEPAKKVAAYFAKRSKTLSGALSKLRSYWGYMGFCNKTHPRYDPRRCRYMDEISKEMVELFSLDESLDEDKLVLITDKDLIPSQKERAIYPYGYPGTVLFLTNIRKSWLSPVKISETILYLTQDRVLGETNIPMLRTYFNAVFETVVSILGLCDPVSPLYMPRVCANLTELKRQSWNLYLTRLRRIRRDYRSPEEVDYAGEEG